MGSGRSRYYNDYYMGSNYYSECYYPVGYATSCYYTGGYPVALPRYCNGLLIY